MRANHAGRKQTHSVGFGLFDTHADSDSRTHTECTCTNTHTITCSALNICWVMDPLRLKCLWMCIVLFVKLVNWWTFRHSNEMHWLCNNTRKPLHNHCGKQCVLDWQSLLEGSYFSNQQSNYKGSLLGSPHVIWSQWRDNPLIGEWLLNPQNAGYKLANTRPAVFINENKPNAPKHVITGILAYIGVHFPTHTLQESFKWHAICAPIY